MGAVVRVTEPFTDQDRYVPRPDVPGHVFARTGLRVRASYGVSISCSCGWSHDWVVLAEATAVENRHRIEVSTPTDEAPWQPWTCPKCGTDHPDGMPTRCPDCGRRNDGA